jgi:N-methylhydantoinase A/oxoprolinase/acetone carboxylase beta subunit
VSVDGQYLYYVKNPGPRLFRMPVGGGEEQQVVPGTINSWVAFGVTSKGVYFQTGRTINPGAVYDRCLLRAGNEVHGPALVIDPESTTFLPPGFTARVDPCLNLVIRKAGSR